MEDTQFNVDRPFAAVLVDLWRAGFTGVLILEADNARTQVYLRDGKPIFAEHGSLGDSLGRFLVRSGRLSEADLARAIKRMTEELFENEELRLGEVLMELQLLGPSEIFSALSDQTRSKLIACFAWADPELGVESGEDHLEGLESFPADVPMLIIDGVREHYSAKSVAELLSPWRSSRVQTTELWDSLSEHLTLAPKARALIRDLGAAESLGAAWKASGLGPEAAGQLLAALTLLGAIAPIEKAASAPATAPPAAKRPATIPPAAKRPATIPPATKRPATIPPAAKRPATTPPAAKRPATTPPTKTDAPATATDLSLTDSPPPRARSSMRRDALLSQLMRGRKPPSGRAPARPAARPRSRPAPKLPQRMDQLAGQSIFDQGLALRREGDLAGARDAFQQAKDLGKNIDEYSMFLACTEMQLEEDPALKRDAASSARGRARAILRREARSTQAYQVLGHVAMAEGKKKEALESFAKAVRCDKTNVEAARCLESLKR